MSTRMYTHLLGVIYRPALVAHAANPIGTYAFATDGQPRNMARCCSTCVTHHHIARCHCWLVQMFIDADQRLACCAPSSLCAMHQIVPHRLLVETAAKPRCSPLSSPRTVCKSPIDRVPDWEETNLSEATSRISSRGSAHPLPRDDTRHLLKHPMGDANRGISQTLRDTAKLSGFY